MSSLEILSCDDCKGDRCLKLYCSCYYDDHCDINHKKILYLCENLNCISNLCYKCKEETRIEYEKICLKDIEV